MHSFFCSYYAALYVFFFLVVCSCRVVQCSLKAVHIIIAIFFSALPGSPIYMYLTVQPEFLGSAILFALSEPRAAAMYSH